MSNQLQTFSELGKKGKPTKGPKDKEKHKNKESKVKDKVMLLN